MLQDHSRNRRGGALGVCAALLTLVVLLVLVRVVVRAETVRSGPLFAESAPPFVSTRINRPEILRRRYVTLDAAGAIQRKELELNLFPGKSLTFERTRTERMGDNGRVWIGRVAGAQGQAVLSAVDDVLVGNIRLERELYLIRYAGKGVHVIYEVDASMSPDQECSTENTAFGSTSVGVAVAPLADPCEQIDVMVVYTPAARSSAGGKAAIEALIYTVVAETNFSFWNSGVNTRIYPVHLAEVSYTESGDIGVDRNRLRDTNDGFIDNVHALRDTYCADVVSLIVDHGGCGVAYRIQDPAPDPAFESDAFDVLVDDCLGTTLAYTHELGHLMGARHDWYVDDTNGPFTYSHGYVDVAAGFITIMAYNDECADNNSVCFRQPVFSNPGYSVGNDPAGIPAGTSTSCTSWNLSNPDCDAEVWQTLNDTACTVANFRDRSVCADVGNVWMKDTWADAGAEPDPQTSGQAMFKSPYIWARLAPLADVLDQHKHENPEFGQTNYVYVKLHNDFSTAASGQLKLYYAQSSTGLSWPADWTLFSDQTVNIEANSTTIAETTWSPPADGHFCLLARWDQPNSPSDPMTFAEGADVGLNTRNNNNIVWRNVHVVDVESNVSADVAEFIVRNTQQEQMIVDLQIGMPNTPSNWVRSGGRVIFDLGVLTAPWIEAGADGFGFEIIPAPAGPILVEILDTRDGMAAFNGIPMEPNQAESVRLTLQAPRVVAAGPFPPVDFEDPVTGVPQQPVTNYSLDVVQFEAGAEVGGVSYEIHVAPEGPAGAVPDGGVRPGDPLRVDKRFGGRLRLSWGASCVTEDTDYALYEGVLGNFVSHVPITCSTDGTTMWTLTPAAGSTYYLVAPQSPLFEGSHGLRSNGLERLTGEAICLAQLVGGCP